MDDEHREHRDKVIADALVVKETTIVEGDEIIDIIDIEEWILAGREPHHRAKRFRIKVDKHKFDFDKPHVTGREILVRADKTPPEKYILRQVHKDGGLAKIEVGQTVDLVRHGIVKFKTMLKTAQDG